MNEAPILHKHPHPRNPHLMVGTYMLPGDDRDAAAVYLECLDEKDAMKKRDMRAFRIHRLKGALRFWKRTAATVDSGFLFGEEPF
jgi:hypothetical protein